MWTSFSEIYSPPKTTKESKRRYHLAVEEFFIVLVVCGVSGWAIGKACMFWRKGKELSKVGNNDRNGEKYSNRSSFSTSKEDIYAFFDASLRAGSDSRSENGTCSTNSFAPKLSANPPYSKCMKTKFKCERCEKPLDWWEAVTLQRPRLISPLRSDFESKARSESESSLMILSSRPSFKVPEKPYRRVICFGDSNTWGFDPASQDRLDCRWPVVLGKELGPGYRVIAEGLCGRTINKPDYRLIDHWGFSHSGLDHLPVVLSSHKPLDLVIIFLGGNDLKSRLFPSLKGTIEGMQQMLVTAKSLDVFRKLSKPNAFSEENSQILLLAPPSLKFIEDSTNQNLFGEKSVEISIALSLALEDLAKKMKVHFLDTSKIVETSELDGRHFGSEMHRKLGIKVAEKVRDLFPAVEQRQVTL